MESYVILAIITAVLYGVGIVFQKKGISKIPKNLQILKGFSINLRNLKILIKKVLNKYFLFGIVITFIGGLFYFTSISLGEISVVIPILNLSLVVVYGLGVIYLKEKLTLAEWFGIGVIFFGVIVLSLVG